LKNIFLYSAFLLMAFSCHSPKSDKSDSLNNVGQTAYYSQVYEQDTFITYTYMPKNEVLQLYWKDESNNILQNFPNLISFTAQQNKELLFAMNGGMYMKDRTPLGLYIEDGKTIRQLNTRSGSGNFYMEPNGVFCIKSDHTCEIIKTKDFNKKNVQYATQSGPMLVINGKINPLFTQNSSNINIRNGVGLSSDNKTIFVISKIPVNFYDFAAFFQELGCVNALYLDGVISKIYSKDKTTNLSSDNFGVIIGITKK